MASDIFCWWSRCSVAGEAKALSVGLDEEQIRRSVRIKKGDFEIEIKGENDIDKVIAALQKLEDKKIIS